jgi:hypothetical protein
VLSLKMYTRPSLPVEQKQLMEIKGKKIIEISCGLKIE